MAPNPIQPDGAHVGQHAAQDHQRVERERAPEMAAIIGIPMPGGNRISTMSVQQAFGLPGEGLQSSLGHRATSNPVKKIGELLEAIEHIERYFSEHQIKPSTEGV